ncbi:N,N-dimethylformamidase beta subunit family domain-containing protein [Singulisphaera sp. Ch08]|uniref:N,N-dimethylformamidase beta subunit family domain-containing protein n=1 Tax=Singulisphaera sp. Ch08 TaxID=3120278 RepID=A0AAU7C8M8_9BACT
MEDRTLLASNPIVDENLLPGNPASEWDINGAGDSSLQGFATDISVDQGQTVSFKINDTARVAYHIDIYRLGYYGGLGARKVATISSSSTQRQAQPAGLRDSVTGLLDCGNWSVSATWAVPASATSGLYLAKLIRDDTGGASHIPFVVRDDDGHSDLLYQTSDTTWQAYNNYGGNSLYEGSSSYGARAVKVSYNRPWNTRATAGGLGVTNWFFWAEYPMVRWMEKNGYNVSYFTDVDSDRRGAEILEHKAFLSVGHDEYWSGGQRNNVEAARDAGVNLAFFSGNEVFWKTRWETSIDGSGTPYRTLVCYKETHANAKIDPVANVWTGTWRDPRFSPPADGGRPENSLTGTIFTVNQGAGGDFGTAIKVPEAEGKLRFWRNTSVATLQAGQTATLSNGTLGYEWDEDLDNGSRPAGLIRLSSTVENVPQRILDNGSNYGPATATHSLTLYRDDSGALVFGAGTVQWSFGLDATHDGPATVPDVRMQQATVNLFADMGIQPGSLQPGLVATTASTDTARPTSVITSLVNGATLQGGTPITISGTATDTGGGIIAAVEISTDGGLTWHRATGRTSWSYNWTPTIGGATSIRTRAVDDSVNLEVPTTGVAVTVTVSVANSLWNSSVTPAVASENDRNAVELGLKFTSDVAGSITGIRFYKGLSNTGTHVAHLWTSTGSLLATATFINESATGWQQVSFPSPVAITANTTYVVSYFAPVGGYAVNVNYFSNSGFDNGSLHAPASAVSGGNGVYLYGSSGGFPTSTYNGSNYWVDPLFTASAADTTPPTISTRSPIANAGNVSTTAVITATFSEALQTGTVAMTLSGPGGAVSGSLAYNSATNTATFTPSAPLLAQTTYLVTVNNAKDTAGNAMASVTWSFTTAAAPLPVLAVNDLAVIEGNSGTVNAVFNVTLSVPSAQAVTVTYATANGTATAGSDYLAIPPATLTFAPGETSKSVTVLILGDTLPEGNEAFFLNLSAPTNATLADPQGQGTIVDDEVTLIGSDGFGYAAYTQPFEALDLVPGDLGVTTIRATGDNNSNAITLSSGLTFNFYGTSYTTLNVSTNGLITFASANTSGSNANLTSAPTQRAIAPLWDDWINTTGNAMILAKYEDTNLDGTNDRLILEWNRVQGAPTSPTPVTFQAILTLNTGASAGDILFNYPSLATGDSRANGASATVGIKDSGTQGANRLLVSFNSTSLYVGSSQAIRIVRDAVAPTVALTGPANGAAVTGTSTVTANASDNVRVAGVQFLLDGVALGAEDTVAPYALTWNTIGVANGVHVLTALARDAAGNVATSAAVTVTVSNTVATALVAAYGFNEGTGTTTTDDSGHGLNGILSNATWTAAGRFGNALVFNGTNALVTVNDNSLLDLTSGMTLEAWVNPVALNGWTTAILKERPGGLAYAIYASDNSGQPPASYINRSGADYNVVGASALALNTWTHVASTYDGATMRLYVNGTLVQTRALAGTIVTSANALRIGGNAIWGEYFNGRIDEVRVYSRALAQSEIQTDMNTPIGGGSGGLAAMEVPTAPSVSSLLTPEAMEPVVVEAAAGPQPLFSLANALDSLAQEDLRIPVDDSTLSQLALELIQARARRSRLVSDPFVSFHGSRRS